MTHLQMLRSLLQTGSTMVLAYDKNEGYIITVYTTFGEEMQVVSTRNRRLDQLIVQACQKRFGGDE